MPNTYATAFADCTALERITLSANEEIGDEVLAACPNLVEPIFDAPVIGQHIYAGVEDAYNAIFTDKVREIKPYAFENTGLRNVSFGSGLEVIGEKAFYKNNLTKIIFPTTAETKPTTLSKQKHLEHMVTMSIPIAPMYLWEIALKKLAKTHFAI